jgi:hypothetical protein
MEYAMQSRNLIYPVLVGTLLVFGCNRAESPQEVQEDVAAAQQEATEQTSEAREDLAANYGESSPEQVGTNEYDLAIAESEGNHKVAIEACEALSGTEQEACKERADTELAVTKERAESQKPR